MKENFRYWIGKLTSVVDSDIGFYAASLSFYSVLSIIPILWVLFFALNQFGIFDEYFPLLKSFLDQSLMPVHAELILSYLQEFMNNARSMGAMGFVYTLIMSILFYKNYQYVVNKILLVPGHNLMHSIATYVVLAFLMPVTLGLSFYLSDYIQRTIGGGGLGVGGFTLLSHLMIWMLFFVLFKVSPNMHINIRIALKVSFIVSIIWHVAKWLFVQYMVINQTYTSLYGTFSVLLFLLVWVYLSWMLLLHGLKVCYLMHCHHGHFG